MNKQLPNVKSEGQMVPLARQCLRGAPHHLQTALSEASDATVGQTLI